MQFRPQLRRIPIRKSLIRNQMILGGERSLVLLSALSSSMVGFTIATGKSFILGVIIYLSCWSLLMFFLKTMAKADPQMSKVFMRANKYRSYYPSKGRICS